MFALFSPYLLKHPHDDTIKRTLGSILYNHVGDEDNTGTATINDQDFQTIKIHFSTLGLINVNYTKSTSGGMGLFWSLTKKGGKLLAQLRSVKKSV